MAPPDASFSISGRITDREGRGVGGARVMAYPQIGSVRDSLIERLILMPPITENAQKPPAQTASGNDGSYRIEGLERRSVAVTDRRGSFEFRGLMPGPLSLKVTAGDHAAERMAHLDASIPAKARGLRIKLELDQVRRP